jgi:hypothetical protein
VTASTRPFFLKELTVKKKTKSEKKLQNLAETCTGLIATAGVSAMDALAIVLNMLQHHSSLVMDPASHDAFIDGFTALLRLTFVSNTHDDEWIIEHADQLKAELLELAKAGAPRPAPGTVLGRALEMFTGSFGN